LGLIVGIGGRLNVMDVLQEREPFFKAINMVEQIFNDLGDGSPFGPAKSTV
jgi:hypothetical protein